ncbi:MAG: flagellar biosynthesis protein FlhB [Desulfatiglandaceae bacterium]
MPDRSDQNRTEPATPKRREEARKKGQLAQSREVSSVLVLLSALGAFFFSGVHIFHGLSDLMRGVFQNISTITLQQGSMSVLLLEIFYQIFIILIPLMLAVAVAGIAANLFQVGFLFTLDPLTPKLSKLNPLSGIKRLLSLRSLAELAKSLLKVVFVGGVAFMMVKSELENIPSLMLTDVSETLSFFAAVSFRIGFYTCLTLIVLAALDYAFQRWQYEKSLRMTKQEVKDELKQREGDPAVKARIRSVQREMARRRMMESVPTADVVITNPTKLAIALKYDPEKMMAPKVTAKGAGFIAERIKTLAKENGVPLFEHKPLAQTLFKLVEIGGTIPANLYQAVAEILAYVYGLKKEAFPR